MWLEERPVMENRSDRERKGNEEKQEMAFGRITKGAEM